MRYLPSFGPQPLAWRPRCTPLVAVAAITPAGGSLQRNVALTPHWGLLTTVRTTPAAQPNEASDPAARPLGRVGAIVSIRLVARVKGWWRSTSSLPGPIESPQVRCVVDCGRQTSHACGPGTEWCCRERALQPRWALGSTPSSSQPQFLGIVIGAAGGCRGRVDGVGQGTSTLRPPVSGRGDGPKWLHAPCRAGLALSSQ